MISRRSLACALLAASLTTGATAASALDLPYHETHLKNGLTVIVHEDHVVPLVAVNLLYRVGARNEEPGRTGFAHLFEHLMFMGTARAPNGVFDALIESGGGTNNATTGNDVTDYFETGPTTLLPTLLWLEADRLSSLGHQIDQAKLDLQRSVVLNERRQEIENRPYGSVELALPELLFPPSHPYHHPVIGSPQDLQAARVADVKAFFERYYRPNNASLVIAGDIQSQQAEQLAERYFGWIPGGEPMAAAPSPPLAPIGKVVRQTIRDQVELPKIVFAYHSPAAFAPGDAELDLFASVLSAGQTGRLYQALVYEKGLAQAVEAMQQSSHLSSTFVVEVLVRPGVSLDAVEQATDAVLRDAMAKPPTEVELDRAKTEFEFQFVNRLQSVQSRARLLNMYWADTGDPGFVNRDLGRYRAATAEGVRAQAAKTLSFGDRVILRVVPAGGVANGPDPRGAAPPDLQGAHRSAPAGADQHGVGASATWGGAAR